MIEQPDANLRIDSTATGDDEWVNHPTRPSVNHQLSNHSAVVRSFSLCTPDEKKKPRCSKCFGHAEKGSAGSSAAAADQHQIGSVLRL